MKSLKSRRGKAWKASQHGLWVWGFWWRRGRIARDARERIDRIRNPQKYLDQVNAPDKP